MKVCPWRPDFQVLWNDDTFCVHNGTDECRINYVVEGVRDVTFSTFQPYMYILHDKITCINFETMKIMSTNELTLDEPQRVEFVDFAK